MPHEIYKRGRFWHYRGTVAARRFRGTTGTTDKVLAQRIAAEAEAREWRSHLDGTAEVLTMAQAMLAYLDAGKSNRFLKKVSDHWKETKVKTITAEAVRQSAKKIYPDASPATWNRQVIVPTAAVINFAAEMGWCQKIKISRFPTDPKVKEPATLEWVNAFASQAVKDGLPHLAALCLFMFGTGARVGQSCEMTWGDVSLTAAKARLYTEKPTPWTRNAHLPPPIVAALANIPSNRNPDDLVFGYAGRGSVKTPWDNVIKRAGIEALSPHCCRHGFATALLQDGRDVKTVADAGGWRDPVVVLRIYAHATKDKTVTNALFGTNLTQPENALSLTIQKQRKKAK